MNQFGSDMMGMTRDAYVRQQRRATRDQYMQVGKGISDLASTIAIGAATGGADGGSIAGFSNMINFKDEETGMQWSPLTGFAGMALQKAGDWLSQGAQRKAEEMAGLKWDTSIGRMLRKEQLAYAEQEDMQRQLMAQNQTQSLRKNVMPNRVDYLKFM